MLSVQSKSPSLAGLFNMPQLQGCNPCRQYPKYFGYSHSAKESAQRGGSEHRSKVSPMFESYISVIPASKQYRNRDLYVEAGGDTLKSQDIRKDSISNSTLSDGSKWDCHYHLGNNADAKIITAAYCKQSKPCYIFRAAAKSADGIETPKTLKATHDAPSVFFYVDAIAHLFITVQIRTESMVMLAGLSSDRPVSFVSGSLNPVSVTTPKDIETSGGDSLNTKEAATMATTLAPKPSFIWIIAAVRRDCPTIKATIHHIAAPTEREARLSLVKDHVCFFVGRINQGVAHA